MMTKEQVQRQAYDLRIFVYQHIELDGFRFDIVLDAIDRARDLGLQHIATYERICGAMMGVAEPTDDLEHDAQREHDLIEGTPAQQDQEQDENYKF